MKRTRPDPDAWQATARYRLRSDAYLEIWAMACVIVPGRKSPGRRYCRERPLIENADDTTFRPSQTRSNVIAGCMSTALRMRASVPRTATRGTRSSSRAGPARPMRTLGRALGTPSYHRSWAGQWAGVEQLPIMSRRWKPCDVISSR